MKTYKQRCEELERKNADLEIRYSTLWEEHSIVLHKTLENAKVEGTDFSVINRLIEGLNEIRQNGGAWSQAKAVELLYILGKL